MMAKSIGWSTILCATLLAACGGGGGSSGENTLQYSITLRADKNQLPLNPSHYGAGTGVYAPFTTTLYVEARQGGMLIPGGEEDVFACNLAGGLESGALYYLDGNDDHEDDDGNPLAYRSITLGANSGGNSFHFHAGDKAGTSRITCSVTDPRDKRVYAANVDIVVGGTTNKPGNVLTQIQAPGYLGWSDNTNRVPNSVVVQTRVFDDLNQPVSNPAGANVSVKILPVPGTAFNQTRLLAGQQSRNPGEDLWVATVGGVGSFMLASGPRAGSAPYAKIILEMTTDRSDNDITNGIADPIRSLVAVDVVNEITSDLVVEEVDISATVGSNVIVALTAIGGLPPYKWATVGGLPSGMSVTTDGILIGTPFVAGKTNVVLKVTDGNFRTKNVNIPITIEELPATSTETGSTTK